MTILKFELKKLLKSKLTLISGAILILLEIYMLLLGNVGHEPCSIIGDPYGKDDNFRYLRTLKETKQYAGEMTQEWYDNVLAEYNAYINDPANLKTDEEIERLKEKWRADGYSEDEIEAMQKDRYYISKDFYTFPEERVLVEVNMMFGLMQTDSDEFIPYSERMAKYAELADSYREDYPGEKGEAFAKLVGDMYTDLSENVTWYYDYDTGWWNYRGIHRLFPMFVGLMLVIALSPLFTLDRARGTESVIACSRHGRGKLTRHKICAGFIFAAGIWALMELIAFIYTAAVFGLDGAETMIQLDLPRVPYMLNQLQATGLVVLTSFVGAMMSAAMIMLVGALCKGQYVTLIISGVLTLIPSVGLVYIYLFGEDSFMERVLDFFPPRMLASVTEWERFDLVYIFGNALPMQYLLIPVALAAGVIMTVGCYISHKNRRPAA